MALWVPIAGTPNSWIALLHKKAVPVAGDANGLVAVNKPEGVVSHPNFDDGGRGSLLRAPYNPCQRAYMVGGKGIFLLNRLDEPTGGLVLLAQSAPVAAAVCEAFRRRTVAKTYYAFTKCGPIPANTWHDSATEHGNGKSVRLRPGANTKMYTETKVLEKVQWESLSCFLLELHPLTGRTHQLRFQCAWHNIPIAGDRVYGDFGYNKAFHKVTGSHKLWLLAAEIELDYTLDGKIFHFFARSPSIDEFLSLSGRGKRSLRSL
ncbi:MAG: RNA pseudouridine synthase [Puniceicoccales bacterium]|jgi:23S rRNA-/tRNA-specific pseudouridylate synthase|nr:RNA pseudouridine synthase [Puniceicoccales bacterium]